MTSATNTTRSPDPAELLNFSDAAAELGLSLNQLRRRVEKDGVPVWVSVADGRERLIARKDLDRWRGLRRLESYRAS